MLDISLTWTLVKKKKKRLNRFRVIMTLVMRVDNIQLLLSPGYYLVVNNKELNSKTAKVT